VNICACVLNGLSPHPLKLYFYINIPLYNVYCTSKCCTVMLFFLFSTRPKHWTYITEFQRTINKTLRFVSYGFVTLLEFGRVLGTCLLSPIYYIILYFIIFLNFSPLKFIFSFYIFIQRKLSTADDVLYNHRYFFLYIYNIFVMWGEILFLCSVITVSTFIQGLMTLTFIAGIFSRE